MEEHPSGVRYTRGAAAISSELAEPLLAAELGGIDLRTFAFSAPPGAISHHAHTQDIGAVILRGAIAFGLGDNFADTADLSAGDMIIIPANVPHAETAGPEGVEAIVGHLTDFETVDV